MRERYTHINGLSQDARDRAYAKRFGVGEKEYQAYRAQKNNASNRGIDFCFTVNEWAIWWRMNLPADARRGRRRGEYVMARRGDRGPYASGNVYATTPKGNMDDRPAAAKEARRHKLLGHAAPHLKDRERHPRARAIITPDGPWPSAALAAEHYGITRQAAANRARHGLFGWSYA